MSVWIRIRIWFVFWARRAKALGGSELPALGHSQCGPRLRVFAPRKKRRSTWTFRESSILNHAVLAVKGTFCAARK